MGTLHDSLGQFAHRLRAFSAQAAEDVHKLQRLQKGPGAGPCVGASAFREACQDLDRQAAELTAEVVHLEGATLDAISLEELLGHCLAVFQLNQRSIERVQEHLKSFGLAPACPGAAPPVGPLADKCSNSQPEPPAAPGSQGSRPKAHCGGAAGHPAAASGDAAQAGDAQPAVTPPQEADSPTFRDLQRKYGALEAPAQETPSLWCRQASDGPHWQQAPDAAVVPRGGPLQQLQQLPSRAVSCSTSLQRSCTGPMPALHRSLDSSLAPWTAGKPGAPEPQTPLSPGLSRRGGRQGTAMARLAAGDPPWDMLSLKAAINSAPPGSGEVLRIITGASFQPQAAAFTALLHMCAKAKLWQHALEVFEAMGKVQPRVVPNTVHFSSLISACATAGRWEEATQVFGQMKALARTHPDCQPNVITYSALMTACCSAGRPERALEVFHDMQAAGIQPDHISFSTLIAGFERSGDLAAAKQLKAEMVLAGVAAKPCGATPTQRTGKPGAPGQQHQLRSPFSSVMEPLAGRPGTGGAGLLPNGSLGQASTSGLPPALSGSPRGLARFPGPALDMQRNYSGSLEESTLDLRKELLHTRSPFQAALAPLQAGSVGRSLCPASPFSTPRPSTDPQGPPTPSTAELLWAAQAQMQQAQAGSRGQVGVPAPMQAAGLPTSSHQRLLQHLSGSCSFASSPRQGSLAGLEVQRSLSPVVSHQEEFSLFDRAPGPHLSAHRRSQSSGHGSPLAPLSPVRQASPQASTALIGTTDDLASCQSLRPSKLGPQTGCGDHLASRSSSGFASPRPALAQPTASAAAPAQAPALLPLGLLPSQQEASARPCSEGPASADPPAAPAAASAAAPAPRTVLPEEHGHLPLRLSRQLGLDELNAAYLSISQLLTEGPHSAESGLTREAIEGHLGQRQALPVLQSLLQLQRLALTVQGGQRLYHLS